MNIKSATVYGLFGVFEHTVTFNPNGITFIHSCNGIGKTVFLKLIVHVLKGDIDKLTEMPFDRLDISFDDDTNLIIENDETPILIQMQKNELEEELTSEELQELKNITLISAERTTIRKNDGRLMYALDAYLEELEDDFLTAKEETAIDISDISIDYDLGDDEIESMLRDLKSKTDYMQNAGLRITVPVELRLPPSRYDINKSHDKYLKLTEALKRYVDSNYSLAESIVVYQDIVNSFFTNKKMRILNGRIIVSAHDKENLSLETLSSGEKQILIMFYRVLFQAEPSSLVIIDEPEISLHVSWQQRIGTVLNDICRLRDLQIVIATHSPQIIHDMWDLANELRPDRA